MMKILADRTAARCPAGPTKREKDGSPILSIAFHFFLELLTRRLLLDPASTVSEFFLPLSSPPCADPVFTLYFPLELSALFFDFDLTRTVSILLIPSASPPTLLVTGIVVIVSKDDIGQSKNRR